MSRRAAAQPHALAARAAAARAVAAVLASGQSLNEALMTARPAEGERALMQALAYGALRWAPRLQWMLDRLLRTPLKQRDADIRALLMVGLFELTELATPPHAAVAEGVEATRLLGKPWAAGLVNAVLRRFQREGEALSRAADSEPCSHFAHPQWLISRFMADWPQHWRTLLEAGNRHPPMSLRVNQRRESRESYRRRLTAIGLEAENLPETESGLRLTVPCDIARLPGFVDGDVSVQDGAAQLAAPLLAAEPGMRVLDACAAPGGKTGHLLERFPGIELTAIDISPGRLRRVAENLRRLDLQARLLAGDLCEPQRWWDGRRFERILIDAPCSGTGVIRRHPDIKVLRREADIDSLAARQKALLEAAWGLLAPGGRLVYATCSILRAENEQVIAAHLQRHRQAQAIDPELPWAHRAGHGRQILTAQGQMDGFYYAVLTKPARPLRRKKVS